MELVLRDSLRELPHVGWQAFCSYITHFWFHSPKKSFVQSHQIPKLESYHKEREKGEWEYCPKLLYLKNIETCREKVLSANETCVILKTIITCDLNKQIFHKELAASTGITTYLFWYCYWVSMLYSYISPETNINLCMKKYYYIDDPRSRDMQTASPAQ